MTTKNLKLKTHSLLYDIFFSNSHLLWWSSRPTLASPLLYPRPTAAKRRSLLPNTSFPGKQWISSHRKCIDQRLPTYCPEDHVSTWTLDQLSMMRLNKTLGCTMMDRGRSLGWQHHWLNVKLMKKRYVQ